MLHAPARRFGILSCLVGTVLLFVRLGAPTDVRSAEKSDAKPDDYYELMKTFADTFDRIERNYVKDVDRRELLEAAIEGMIGRLDQYSSYISPQDLAQFNQQVEQEFGGVGIQVQIDPETKRLTVTTPLPGTPAYKAGVRAGDTILEIAGKSTEGYSILDAVRLLKGKPGEPVTIGVRHEGAQKIEQIEIVRDVIHVATVLGDHYNDDGTWNYMLDDQQKIGYVRLTHFSRRSGEELREALKTLKSQGMRALILDLRFDPGGLLSQARAVADLFIEDGTIVSTQGRNTEPRVLTATKEGTFTGFPMAVLVNHYSASASEIVSACLQDHDRAAIVGERTWGKGSVQNIIELEEGKSALKLTTASYHRPSGKNIHRFPGAKDSDVWGVMPDKGLKVAMSPQQMQKYLEFRRERDVLKKGGPPENGFQDPQLDKAVAYLTEKLAPATTKPAEKKPAAAPKEPPAPEKPKPADKAAAEKSRRTIRIPVQAAA